MALELQSLYVRDIFSRVFGERNHLMNKRCATLPHELLTCNGNSEHQKETHFPRTLHSIVHYRLLEMNHETRYRLPRGREIIYPSLHQQCLSTQKIHCPDLAEVQN